MVGRAGADQAGGELVEVGLAHAHRPGIDQLLHRRGVLQRQRLERRAGGGGGEAGDVDVVLAANGTPNRGRACIAAVRSAKAAARRSRAPKLRGKLGGARARDPGGDRALGFDAPAQGLEQDLRRFAGAIGLLPVGQGEQRGEPHAAVWCVSWYTSPCTAGTVPIVRRGTRTPRRGAPERRLSRPGRPSAGPRFSSPAADSPSLRAPCRKARAPWPRAPSGCAAR